MSIFRFSAFLLLPIVLFACSRPVAELSGIVTYGHEVRTVQLCGYPQLYWLHMTPEQHDQMEAEYQKLARQPYQELYLDFTGQLEDINPGEFAKSDEGTIRIEQIRAVSAIIPDNCDRVRSSP